MYNKRAFGCEIYCLLCWPGGTNPNPDAPITTPELSTGASGGDIGNTTGPVWGKKKKHFSMEISWALATFTNTINELTRSWRQRSSASAANEILNGTNATNEWNKWAVIMKINTNARHALKLDFSFSSELLFKLYAAEAT